MRPAGDVAQTVLRANLAEAAKFDHRLLARRIRDKPKQIPLLPLTRSSATKRHSAGKLRLDLKLK